MRTLFRALRRFLLGDVCGRLIPIIIMIYLIKLTMELTKPIPVVIRNRWPVDVNIAGTVDVNVDGTVDVNVDTIEGRRPSNAWAIPVTIE